METEHMEMTKLHTIEVFICDNTNENTVCNLFDLSPSSIHEDMTSPELNSDDDMDMDFIDLSEGYGRSDCDSFQKRKENSWFVGKLVLRQVNL